MNDRTAIIELDVDQFMRTEGAAPERKKAALRLAREYGSLLDNINDVIFIVDNEGHFVFVNKASERRTGIPTEKFIGRHFLELVDRQYHEFAQGAFQKLSAGEKIPSIEMSRKTPSGQDITVEVSLTPIYEDNVAIGMLGVSRDVTDRKRAEEALRKAREELETRVQERTEELLKANEQLRLEIEERMRAEREAFYEQSLMQTLLDNIPDYVYFKEKDRRFVRASNSFSDLFGRSLDEIIGKKDEDLFPEEIAEETANDDRHVIETGIPLVNKEEGGKSIGGREHWVLTTKLPWRDKKGNIIGLFGISKEITDRKRGEEALRESEEKFRAVSEQSPNMIFINKAGKVVYANKVCEEIMGYKRDEFYSPDFDFLRLIAPESVDSIRSAFKRHMDGEEVEPYEYTLVNKEGNRIEAIITTKLMNYEGERAILGIVTDISERKRVEKALRESETRLRSLSVQLMRAQEKERMRISKELHDELGQALALLKHRVRSVQSKLQKGQSSLHEEFEGTSRYIEEIIENVRRLSRDLSPSILEDLGLTSALQWLTKNFEKQYSLVTSFDIDNIDDLFPKEAQTNLYRISQEALTNIAKHAEAKHVSFTVKGNEGSVALIIEDDGKGFDVNRVRAIHSPEKGLGLDAMEERAHVLGTSLHIKSQVGEGTRITLTIPIRKVGKE